MDFNRTEQTCSFFIHCTTPYIHLRFRNEVGGLARSIVINVTKNSSDLTTVFFYNTVLPIICFSRECSGSVVECLTRDSRFAGSGLTRVSALCP